MRPKVLAVASGGGHWVQLMRLMPAFDDCQVVYACVQPAYSEDVLPSKFYRIGDVTRWSKWKVIPLALKLLVIFAIERPGFVVTTGSAPGYVALRLGKLLRARTVWVDSIANVDSLSASGEQAGRYADVWLTQWPHLARSDGPEYSGAVM